MIRNPRPLALAILGLVGACDNGPESQARPIVLGPATIVQVGSHPIDEQQVAAVASARGLSPQAAVEALTRDALFAEAFRMDHSERAQFLTRTALARQQMEAFLAEAIAAGPPSEEELQEHTARNWWHMDRPAMTRVTHAIVLSSLEKASDAERARAERVSQRLAGVIKEAKNLDDFRRLAEAFPAAGFEIKVEDLDPVAADGRVVNPKAPPPPGMRPQTYAPAFAEAASKLSTVGEHSPVVATEFGYHILRCTELLPALRVPENERRKLLREEIIDQRAAKLQDEVLATVRKSTTIEVELSAASVTEGLQAPP